MTALLEQPKATLRDYQRAAVDALFDWFRTRDGDPAVAMATGSGKSITMSAFIAEARANYPQLRVVMLAPQIELIRQNVKAASLLNDPRDIGIYSASANQKDATRPITVATVQSISRKAFGVEPFDLAVIDEAHAVADADSGQMRAFITAQRQQNPALRLAGFTATPYKLSSGKITEGANALFSGIAYEASIVDLVHAGHLARPVTPKTRMTISTEGVAMRGGEFVLKALQDAVDVTAVTEAAVEETIRLCRDRKHWLVFAVSVEHAKHIGEAFTRRGIPTTVVYGELPRDEREYRIHAYRTGEARCCVNVNLLSVGFDHPATDAVVLMRPTASPGLYTQMVGRVMRTAPGKVDGLVVDLAGCIERHGPVDAIVVREKKEKGDGEAVVKCCPVCEMMQAAGVRTCLECGHLFPPPPLPLVTQASTAPILSIDVAPVWADVSEVRYTRNAGKKQADGSYKTDTLRATYYAGFRPIHSEFWGIEHTGGYRAKSARWFEERCSETCPATIDEAIALLEADSRMPTAIATRPQRDKPQYQETAGYRWPDSPAPSGLPRACWSCLHFEPLTHQCGKWHATPPADVQAVGCDAWDDSEPSLPF